MREPEQNSAGEVPEWALERAKYLRDRDVGLHPTPAVYAFARYIAAHEPEPVDPVTEEVRQLAHKFGVTGASNLISIRSDDFRAGLAEALRRGMELARGVTMEKNNG